MTTVADTRRGDGLGRGELTALAVSFPPDEESLAVDRLAASVSVDDTVILVTANVAPAAVISAYEPRFAGPATPTLAIVDTTAGQSFEDSYHDVTVVGIPGIDDLTRTSIAVSDLAAVAPGGDGDTHLVVPDLSPFIALTNVDLLLRAFETLLDHGAISGATVVAFDYKAHSTETVSRLLELASVVVWADRDADGTLSQSTVERPAHRS